MDVAQIVIMGEEKPGGFKGPFSWQDKIVITFRF